MRPAFLCLLSAFLLPAAAPAAPLQQATITEAARDVRIKEPGKPDRKAAPGAVFSGRQMLVTGSNARAEIQFPDKTLVRLGASTVFSFTPGKRNMILSLGTILVQIPKGLGGGSVLTAAATAAISGTTFIVNTRSKTTFKMIMCEGEGEAVGDNGQRHFLAPGALVSRESGDSALRPPTIIHLQELVRTSTFFTSFKGALPSRPLIDREIQRQLEHLKTGRLAPRGKDQDAGDGLDGPGLDAHRDRLRTGPLDDPSFRDRAFDIRARETVQNRGADENRDRKPPERPDDPYKPPGYKTAP